VHASESRRSPNRRQGKAVTSSKQPTPYPKGMKLRTSVDLTTAALAYPQLTGSLRSAALSEGKLVNIEAVSRYLGRDTAPMGGISRLDFKFLDEHFGTENKKRQLAKAYDGFFDYANDWERGARRHPQGEWILPESFFEIGSSFDFGRIVKTIQAITKASTPKERRSVALAVDLIGETGNHKWLRYLSLEMAQLAQTITPTQISELHQAVLLGVSFQATGDVKAPWQSNFPTQLEALPNYWLYQFMPTNTFGRLLTRMDQRYCTHLGHLAMMDRATLKDIKSVGVATWSSVAVALVQGEP
jgi:hypothetical protein